jgi:hypothetical protein
MAKPCMAVGFVEANGLGILNPGVSRSWGRARADISLCESVSEFIDSPQSTWTGLPPPSSKKICDLPVPRRPPENHRIR